MAWYWLLQPLLSLCNYQESPWQILRISCVGVGYDFLLLVVLGIFVLSVAEGFPSVGFEFHPSWQWRCYCLKGKRTITITLWKQLSSCWNCVFWLWVLSPLFTLAFHHYATSFFTQFLLSGHPFPVGLTLHTSISYWTASFLQLQPLQAYTRSSKQRNLNQIPMTTRHRHPK